MHADDAAKLRLTLFDKNMTPSFTNILSAPTPNGCPLIIWTEFALVYLPYLSVDLHQTFNTDALGH